jgi:hypothetical protein
VRSEILKEASNGPLYLHVAPGGVAAFTNTKTFSQAGDETPAANANAAANTTAASQPSRPGTPTPNAAPFALPANAPMGMRNNNPLNIKYAPGVSYEGLVGPSANTDQGDPQNVFKTPEAGWAAAYSLLNKKYGSGMTTPNALIAGKGGWTPGNTQAAANVAKAAGIGPDDDIGFSDPNKAAKFMRALVQQEQGGASSAYTDAMIANAISGKALPATAVAAQPAPGTTINSVPAVASTQGVLPGFPDKASSDSFTQGAKAFDKAWNGDQGDQSGQDGRAAAFQPVPARNVSPLIPPAGSGAVSPQAYGTTLAGMMTPPQWSSAPPGQSPFANVGGQQFGTQLGSMQQLQQMMAMMGNPYGDAGYG